MDDPLIPLFRTPIYTEKARCQDCYKCVRACPVKAIKVVEDSATVMAERCVYCGTCVNVCPVGAKKVRDDLELARRLLRRKERVVLSLAPSFVTEFPGLEPRQLIHALRNLGFWAVSETALGAQAVSSACALALEKGGPGVHVSTACPTVVELIRRYHVEQLPLLTPLLSPLLAHCKLLRQEYGEDIGIVFVGPCIAKKLEADGRPDLLNLALTFADLHRWLEEEGVDPAACEPTELDRFQPTLARDGALYPADGGMTRSIAQRGRPEGVTFMAFSGIHSLQGALAGLKEIPDQKLFLELLACEGGCVNGPQVRRTCGTALKWMQVMGYAAGTGESVPTAVPALELDLRAEATADPVVHVAYDAERIQGALRRVGKTLPEDELNCGGCGYDTCRNLAEALLEERAEPNMCVSYMRKLAMNKANTLIRSMPAGVVLVDENLHVIECNRRFAETLGGDTPDVFDVKPGLGGADLGRLAPELKGFFARGLEKEVSALRREVQVGDRILRLTVFTIEAGRLVGGVLQDITEPAVQREQVLQQAQEVIRKNVATVQKIAFLLGENAAETEMMLESLSSSFRNTPSPLGGPASSEDARRGN
ncbi:[Fe-Fe] hydrogenase large subunit C-terminal domain-containing protein [Geothrix sp. PMB-07]|uniref:[Fe-Fe] hydrogenase large subunit C-terminal domain-containing protein n=1 Tax=Geothrix sp. PMB-07 TaxID=3068640 RepID=UPI0027422096|nr:[Fe-Fe] hydrogenase large subunit C-terminal domain-containing protein [Geothrix sp. PMB-07]WLT31033.1 [Fe-Fe] hydrogenase large subunit C-terminal domain-containing protein [Geothrix sp. PMB-07]